VIAAITNQIAALAMTARSKKVWQKRMTTANPPSLAAERKKVTILFADISGFTAMSEQNDAEVVRERINTCFSRLGPVVKKHSGTIEKYIGDEIMAIFGAPIVHENDAELAALAALEMMEALSIFNQEFGTDLGIHMGINTGAVIAGGIGAQDDLQYGVLGDTVNVAARLADAAERGQIFVGENTSRLIAAGFQLRSLDPIRMRGKSSPVEVSLLQGVKEKPSRKRGLEGYGLISPVVGRAAEISLLGEAVKRLYTGRGGIVGIIGEAGLGKTRLITEMVQNIHPQSWKEQLVSPEILTGTTLSYGQTISFWPFMEILRQYAGITEQDSSPTAWEKLETRTKPVFPDELDEFLPYLASLLAIDVPDEWGQQIHYLDADGLRRQIFLAVRGLCGRLAEARPLILILEDLHWMDETSIRLLEYLLPLVETQAVLIIGLSRPDRNIPAAQLQRIIAENYARYYQEIRLKPLSPADSDLLARSLLHLQEIPPRLRGILTEKTEGNPFFLEEVVRTLVEARAVVPDPATNTWKITDEMTKVAIPDTIQGVIMARIDRLDEEVKHVLRLAAVIGRSFLYSVLKAIEAQDDDLEAGLAELQQIELILEKRKDPELEYIFKHALAQEATYETILLQQRGVLHERVGRAIEELFSDRLEEFYGLLAYHYARAENWGKAQFYLMKAGDEAGRLAADAEALTFYKQAIEVYQRAFGDRWDPVQRASLERKIGEALWRRGEHLQALEHLGLGLSFLGQAMPSSPAVIRLEILKGVVRQLGHRMFPRIFLPRLTAAPSPEEVESVLLYEVISWIEVFNNPERFLLGSLRELNIAEKSRYPLGIVLSSTGVGMTAVFIHLNPLAKFYLKQAESWANKIDNPIASGMIQYGLTVFELSRGNFEQAALHGEKSFSLYHQAGDFHNGFLARASQGIVMFYQGLFEEANSLGVEVTEQSRNASDQMGMVQGLIIQGFISRLAGEDLDQTIIILEQAVELSMTVLYHMGTVGLLSGLGRCYTQKGDIDQALTAFQKGREIAREKQVTMPFAISENYLGLPEVYLAAAEQAKDSERAAWMKKASRACQEAVKLSKNFPGAMPEAMRLQGWYDWLRGKPAKARQWWERSLEKAEALGMRYQVAMARLEMGRRLGDEEQLRRAEVELRAMGVRL
jgi:class 3 adenylate cyclase/tetratricopeptide (TPR) repeat protein